MTRLDLLRDRVWHFRDYTPDLNGGGFFNDFNSSKYGITLNLNHPKGVEIVKQLVAISDVVIDEYAQGHAQMGPLLRRPHRSAISLPSVPPSKAIRGRMPTISGSGTTYRALSGINHLTGYADGYPLGTSVNYPDFVIPMFVASVIMSALLYRRRTGKGQHIDLSQYQAMATLLGPALMDYMVRSGCYPHGWTISHRRTARGVSVPRRGPLVRHCGL